MNKRILSLVLVLCTILVSVPVFALPAAATTPETKIYEYATSFSENLPTVSDDGTTITYNGNWTAWAYHKETWVAQAFTARTRLMIGTISRLTPVRM